MQPVRLCRPVVGPSSASLLGDAAQPEDAAVRDLRPRDDQPLQVGTRLADLRKEDYAIKSAKR